MKCPNRITIIVAGVVGAAALACFLLLPKKEQPVPKPDATEPTRNSIQIQTPTDPTQGPPVIIVPEGADPTNPSETVIPPDTQPNDPVVEDSNTEEQIKDTPEEDPAPEDSVVDIGKPEDAMPDPEQGEIRNDAILQEKEENAPKDDREDVIVTEEDEVTTSDPKEEVSENDPNPEDDGQGNKNSADSETPADGNNPFDEDVETDIEDTPVEDLIGDDEERPGDGIHF